MLALVKKIQKLIGKNLKNIGKSTDNDIPIAINIIHITIT
jgi:hypothetical protein